MRQWAPEIMQFQTLESIKSVDSECSASDVRLGSFCGHGKFNARASCSGRQRVFKDLSFTLSRETV
jgi:hypothetical protein